MKKDRIKKVLSEKIDMPSEIILDLPKIQIVGNGEMLIENYKGILEYTTKKIRIKTKKQIIEILGEHLELNAINDEFLSINGLIEALNFENGEMHNG